MYVSRGIGTSLLPVRFACRPELAIITIQPMAN
jgi:predicted MPP superfamily phosphohydrolase